ncbi:MAG: hypothetical protein M5U12_32725 [Verrucomicrobia bacterium]|nr:hypothetical protein [Verrucomicrobiota bacterium]
MPNPAGFAQPGRLEQLLEAPDRAIRVHTWNPESALEDFPDLFANQAHGLAQRDLKPNGWRLESPVGLRLLDRIRAAGKPLREYAGSRVYRGITTGLNEAFVVDSATRDKLIGEHKSSAALLKPFARGRDVERWVIAPQQQWLIFTRRGTDIRHYPAILIYLKQFKTQLMPGVPGGRKSGSYEWFEIQDNIAYWQEFERAKLVSTKVSIRPTFALDITGCYLGNTSYFIPAGHYGLYILGLLNSRAYEGYARRAFVEKQGGWYEVQPDGLESFPIPPATSAHQFTVEQLVRALIWLYGQGAAAVRPTSPRDPLMREHFEQLLNGLVYELFFPAELHARALKFFDLLAQAGPPRIDSLPASCRMDALREFFEQTYEIRHPLRAALFDLGSLEVVRIIEGKE